MQPARAGCSRPHHTWWAGWGRWAIFGDFTRQALYGATEEPVAALSLYSEHFVRARLTLNCRNTRRIAEETTLVADFENPPFRCGDEIGLPVEHRYWRTPADLLEALTKVVDHLIKDKVPAEDITILSPRRLEHSGLAGIERISRFPLLDISRGTMATQSAVKFSTIHSFKGLESAVVILVDIDQVEGG